MKKIEYEKVDEVIYYEKVNDLVDLYLYPTNKTKNFYITITVKYGAKVLRYKIGDNIFDVTPGSAHFLEHKVMSFSENAKVVNTINALGLHANAYTSYDATNYNLYGSTNIEESIILLLDMFYKPNINQKNVEGEKSIICEEIDMTFDQLNTLMSVKLLNNLFNNSFLNTTVLGSKEDILSQTPKKLTNIYKDFYVADNTFITVCGNFDAEKVYNVIFDYIKSLKLRKREVPKVIRKREKENVRISLEKISRDISASKVKIGYKISKKIFGIKNNEDLRGYVNFILKSNISVGSALYEKYKKEDLIVGLGSNCSIFDDYLVIFINATTNKPEEFINRIDKDLRKLTLSPEEFERKKKNLIKSYILTFDDIIDVEALITDQVLARGKLIPKEYSEIVNMNYNEALSVLKNLHFDNRSVIIVNRENSKK